jgi:hypothetical protein
MCVKRPRRFPQTLRKCVFASRSRDTQSVREGAGKLRLTEIQADLIVRLRSTT